ncbi:hypothetical protein PanWU01x14_350240 [Parasponia andersonii]|uniref:Uncharacterized protein n=1 Tax=Parasponia andersonii TaxID=3476 RepID=A0A2P5AB26_PARAD|nr:hypothetical protein PanWU01x14_350240 [Parasponia andersonii]
MLVWWACITKMFPSATQKIGKIEKTIFYSFWILLEAWNCALSSSAQPLTMLDPISSSNH